MILDVLDDRVAEGLRSLRIERGIRAERRDDNDALCVVEGDWYGIARTNRSPRDCPRS